MRHQRTQRWLLFLFAGLAAISVSAQTDAGTADWHQAYQQLLEDYADDESATLTDGDLELLQQLADHPINLNATTRSELEQLPFLSPQQVMDLIEYLDRYRPVRSLGELRMVRSLSYQQLALLPHFVYIGAYTPPATMRPPTEMRHTLTATANVPFYERQGDNNGYLGYKYRHALRYELNYGKKLRAGLIGAQDAGEPFFANRNRWGYDAYSYYLQVNDLGPVATAIVGKYKLSAGMGLVLNNGFSMGKAITLQSLGRLSQGLRPHSSRSEQGYFQGAAATISLGKLLSVTLMASHRGVDATLNDDDGTAKTLIYSGYHRTPGEIQKKYNTHLTALGATTTFRTGAFHMGASAIYTHTDRTLRPDLNQSFRHDYPQGHQFFNASLYYGYDHRRWTLRGETAINQEGALATIHALSHQSRSGTTITALHRFYSHRYSSFYAHSFSEGSRVQNEHGFYVGATCRPLAHLQLQTYADYAYFPRPRYRVSQSSQALDLFLQANYQRARWDLSGRLRARFRQQDNDSKTLLTPVREQRGRLAATYRPTECLSLKSQLDLAQMTCPTTSRGIMVSQQGTYQSKKHLLCASAALFHTDDYDSRLYLYERQLRYDFSFPMYYGQGVHLMLLARTAITPQLHLTAKLGYTNYFDRAVIGSGQQQIPHSSATDLSLQLHYRF